MRIIFCATYYQKYLDSFFKETKFGSDITYAAMLEVIKQDYFGVYGSYVDYAQKHGQEAFLMLSNVEPLQKLWAKEVGFIYPEDNWEMAIAIEQVKQFRPDVFFLGSIFQYYTDFLVSVKPFCKKVVSWISCPIPEDVYLKNIDLLLTSVPSFVDYFRSLGIKSELLPAAFDGRILKMMEQPVERDIPLSFIGGLAKGHGTRTRTIESLARHTTLHWYGYAQFPPKNFKNRLKAMIKTNPLEKAYRGEVWGMEMYKTLQRSLITFNAHIDIAAGHRVNMRMYEATGMGALLLLDKPEKGGITYFEDGKEVVTYGSPEEAVEKVSYLLNHPNELSEIAKRGQEKTLAMYNYDNNIQLMLSYFQNSLAN